MRLRPFLCPFAADARDQFTPSRDSGSHIGGSDCGAVVPSGTQSPGGYAVKRVCLTTNLILALAVASRRPVWAST